jgi:hypothetical protein
LKRASGAIGAAQLSLGEHLTALASTARSHRADVLPGAEKLTSELVVRLETPVPSDPISVTRASRLCLASAPKENHTPAERSIALRMWLWYD